MNRLFRRGAHGDDLASKFKPELAPVPEGGTTTIMVACPRCKEPLYVKELEDNQHVCPKCGYHHRISAQLRVSYTFDDGSFAEWDAGVTPTDPLHFGAGDKPYADKLAAARAKSASSEALVTGYGAIEGVPAAVAIADFDFFGATMGSVYGEKLARAAERAIVERLPLVTFNASGGARMQEGLFSLMQMAKTTAAINRLGAAGLPHISVLTDPCYGGVTASYATVADVMLAEPGAMIGFAGKRVIEQIMKKKLPDDCQTAEFQMEHGMIDGVVSRRELRQTLASLLALYCMPRLTPTPVDAERADAEREPLREPAADYAKI